MLELGAAAREPSRRSSTEKATDIQYISAKQCRWPAHVRRPPPQVTRRTSTTSSSPTSTTTWTATTRRNNILEEGIGTDLLYSWTVDLDADELVAIVPVADLDQGTIDADVFDADVVTISGPMDDDAAHEQHLRARSRRRFSASAHA